MNYYILIPGSSKLDYTLLPLEKLLKPKYYMKLNQLLTEEHTKPDPNRQNVTCPFCNETDFDLIGLKNHFIRGHCDEYNDTKSL